MRRRPHLPWAARPKPKPRPPLIRRPGLPFALDAHWPAPLRPAEVGALGPTPASGAPLGPGMALFHDAQTPQLSATLSDDGALHLAIDAFDGTFLSFVIDVPPDLLADLAQDHIFGLHSRLSAEAICRCYARLNIRAGPNTAVEVEQLPPDTDEPVLADFGIDRMRLDLTRIEAAWLDLILDAPLPAQLVVSDLALYRRHRPRF